MSVWDLDVELVQVTIFTERDGPLLDSEVFSISAQLLNKGTDTGPFTVRLVLDGHESREEAIDDLAAGETKLVYWMRHDPLSAGDHNLTVSISTGDSIYETAGLGAPISFHVDSLMVAEPRQEAAPQPPLRDDRVAAKIVFVVRDHTGSPMVGYHLSARFNDTDDQTWGDELSGGGNLHLPHAWVDPSGSLTVYLTPIAGGVHGGEPMLWVNTDYRQQGPEMHFVINQGQDRGEIKAATRDSASKELSTRLGFQWTITELFQVSADRGTTAGQVHEESGETTREWQYEAKRLTIEQTI